MCHDNQLAYFYESGMNDLILPLTFIWHTSGRKSRKRRKGRRKSLEEEESGGQGDDPVFKTLQTDGRGRGSLFANSHSLSRLEIIFLFVLDQCLLPRAPIQFFINVSVSKSMLHGRKYVMRI